MNDQPLGDVTDDDLLPRVATGDAAAFTALFRRRQADVYRFALHMTGQPNVAEDVTQEVFLAVIGDAARYQPGRSTVAAWLCGMARNHVHRRWERDRGLSGAVALDDDGLQVVDAGMGADPLGELTRTERIQMLRRTVLTLPVRYREAVVLCDLQELTYADAAAALACAIGTVRSRLHRGRAMLAEKMRADERTRNVGLEPDSVRSVRLQPDPADTPRGRGAKPITRCMT